MSKDTRNMQKEEECPSEQKASLCGCEKARNRWFSAVDRQTKIRTKENSKEDLKEDDRCQSLFTLPLVVCN
jgi:hypothetical protein